MTTSLSPEAFSIISRTRATLACCDLTRLSTSATFSVTSCASTFRRSSFPLPSRAPITASKRSPGTRRVSVEVIRPSLPRSVDSLPTYPPAPSAAVRAAARVFCGSAVSMPSVPVRMTWGRTAAGA